MAPIFIGPVGAGVSVGTDVGVGVAVGANVFVAMGVGVELGSVSPPQAGNSTINKLNANKLNQRLLHFSMNHLPIQF